MKKSISANVTASRGSSFRGVANWFSTSTHLDASPAIWKIFLLQSDESVYGRDDEQLS